MKKFRLKVLLVISAVFIAAISSAYAASYGRYMGPSNNLFGYYYTATDMGGDYIVVSLEGYGNEKQVYARMGDIGAYSDWAGPKTLRCERADWGGFGDIGASHWGYIWNYK